MRTGIYVHFPFCGQKCDYCDFYSIPLTEEENTTATYIEAVQKEADMLEEKLADCEVDTIYLGGGTPSIMGADDIAAILGIIRSRVRVVDVNAEITLECNPAHMNREFIENCVSAGINRVTLGIQTTDPRHHQFIGRRGECPDTGMLQQFFEIENITHAVDMMAGIPGQEKQEFRTELSRVLDGGPEHVSMYMLTREEGTPFYHRFTPHETWEDEQRDIFEEALQVMEDYGYTHYEISNFALPGYQSRHNLKYWKYQPYIGLGPGAHSFFDGIRWYNMADVKEYMQHPGTMQVIDNRSREHVLAEYLMSAIRLIDGFYLEGMEKKTGMDIPEQVYASIEKLSDDKMLEVLHHPPGTSVRLTREGIFHLDSIVYTLVHEIL